ncbi:hypothetical protein [Flavobacterium lindanitolerans]|uniref:hypothetical protein n=1 Tax=Flavobacterium lindanitolerans TaxID=428988 RepID=UPI0027B9B0C0|nr:hypothetical protein [Flavobacterium lindanitolerans]
MKNYILLSFVIVFFVSCKTGKLSTQDTLSQSETVIIGEIRIMNGDKEVTKNSKIYFDEITKGVLFYKLAADGLVMMKLPKGNHFIKYIYTPYGSVNLPIGYANFSVPETGKVYYIGTILIDTEKKLRKKSRGIIYDTDPKGLKEEKVQITISDTPQKVSKAYHDAFGTDKKIENALLTVAP